MKTLGMSYLCNSMFIFKIHTQTLIQSQCMINSLSNLITSVQFSVWKPHSKTDHTCCLYNFIRLDRSKQKFQYQLKRTSNLEVSKPTHSVSHARKEKNITRLWEYTVYIYHACWAEWITNLSNIILLCKPIINSANPWRHNT